MYELLILAVNCSMMNVSVGVNITLKGSQNSSSVIFTFFFFSPFCCLQRSIDDKFRCVEEREAQVRRLQLALREKERDLERLRCILSGNEETITVRLFCECLRQI